MNKKLVFALLGAFFIIPCSHSAELDYHLFVSNAHSFSVQYPETWNRADVVHLQTVIRVESPDGDDFNITVVENPSLQSMSPSEYTNLMYNNVEQLLSSVLSQNYPDAKLVRKGTTKLSQQAAVYYEVDFTLSAAGREIAMRSYAISTKYRDKQYTLTFRTPKQFFAEYRPIIEVIALGFQFTKFSVQ